MALFLKSKGYYPSTNLHYATNWLGKSQEVGYWLRMRLMIEILSIILSRASPHLNYEIAPSAGCGVANLLQRLASSFRMSVRPGRRKPVHNRRSAAFLGRKKTLS